MGRCWYVRDLHSRNLTAELEFDWFVPETGLQSKAVKGAPLRAENTTTAVLRMKNHTRYPFFFSCNTYYSWHNFDLSQLPDEKHFFFLFQF